MTPAAHPPRAAIADIAGHLPEQVLTNDVLAQLYPDWPAEKILAKTGIRERRIAAPRETAADLAYEAARKLFAQGAVGADQVDFVILCTQAPDYVLPTSACMLQHRLGIPTHAGALDVNLGCSGYVYGLSLAKGLVETGAARCVLLLTADTYSKYLHPLDKSVRTLFGDGARAPADVLMTVDIGNLLDLVDGGLTQPVRSASLDGAIPANLRGAGGNWYALSLRDRVLYVDKNMQLDAITYESLADPKWKGKVCVRSGQHPYNTALVAAMIAHDGEAAAEQWLRGVKANLARKATGGDRDVARDILGGICDIGLANAYYAGHMKHAQPGTDARKWGDAIKVVRPTFANAKSGGTHVNVSGAAVAKHAPNRDNAVKLLEYLASPPAQALYAQANYEYPVRAGVALDPVIAGFGPLKVDPLPLVEIAKYRKRASQLVDKVGFDN